jgi:hypothetical protein
MTADELVRELATLTNELRQCGMGDDELQSLADKTTALFAGVEHALALREYLMMLPRGDETVH